MLKQTTFLTLISIEALTTLSIPLTFVFVASIGKNSHDGTCFKAAALKT